MSTLVAKKEITYRKSPLNILNYKYVWNPI